MPNKNIKALRRTCLLMAQALLLTLLLGCGSTPSSRLLVVESSGPDINFVSDAVVDVTTTILPGQHIFVSQGVTVTFNRQIHANDDLLFTGPGHVKLAGVVRGSWFGLNGIDKLDKVKELQAAIDSLSEGTGSVLILAGGEHHVSQAIYINKREVMVRSEGNLMTRVVGVGGLYDAVFIIPSTYRDSRGAGYVTFRDLSFVSPRTPLNLGSALIQIGGRGPGLGGGGMQVTGVKIQNCRFSGAHVGVRTTTGEVGGVSNGDIEIAGCAFDGVDTPFIFTDLTRALVINNQVYDTHGAFLILGGRVDNVLVSNNTVAGLRGSAVEAYPDSEFGLRFISVTNNTFDYEEAHSDLSVKSVGKMQVVRVGSNTTNSKPTSGVL